MSLALYHEEHGFYSGAGQAGRRGDFITSPEVGPLFGHVVAHAIDAEWARLGRPEVFTVIDYGAGPGTLARGVLAAEPECGHALRYVAVEQSVEQRAQHPEAILSLDALTPEVIGGGIVGVVLANELLDNLAFTPLQRDGGALQMLDVTVGPDGCLTVVPSATPRDLEQLFDPAVESAILQEDATAWLAGAQSVLTRGRVIVIDYARRRSAEVEIRTYAEHEQAGDPLAGLGTKDITVDVDLEQLERVVGPATEIRSQAVWLDSHGIDELVEEGRRMWEQNAGVGDLSALRFRSRIREAEALLDPDGLGGFSVAEWVVD